ncbi:hypothetical protein [Akkermansia sp.]|uniref:hypothetical protein n=1 Tax=Akkermansia sp. TaxID=1872421 RepID=UPI00399496F6
MINSAIQEGINVRIIASSGQTLFTRRGELLGFTSMSVTLRRGDTVYICKPDGSTQSTRRYQGGRTAYDNLVDSDENKPRKTWTKGTVILYLFFGWLIKIGAGYRLYKLMGSSYLAVEEVPGELTPRVWKDVGIWLMSVIFWIICIGGSLYVLQ